MFDIDKACTRCNRMWRKLGIILERRAYDAAEKGLRVSAMEYAKSADACFFQATGENECIDFQDASK